MQCRYHFSLLAAHARHHGQMPSPPPAQPGFRDKRSRPGGGWTQSGSHGCTGTRGPAVHGQPRGLPLSCVWGRVWKLRSASFARCPLASQADVAVAAARPSLWSAAGMISLSSACGACFSPSYTLTGAETGPPARPLRGTREQPGPGLLCTGGTDGPGCGRWSCNGQPPLATCPAPSSLDWLSGSSSVTDHTRHPPGGEGGRGCLLRLLSSGFSPSLHKAPFMLSAPPPPCAPSHPHPSPWRQGRPSWHGAQLSTQGALCLARSGLGGRPGTRGAL